MANPKYIDEALLPDDAAESNDKKSSKKPYSFRCDETLLEDISKYAEIEGITLPQLLSNIMDDFLADKVLTNTYLPDHEGQYINIPSNVDKAISHEYEIRYVPNNLDVWHSKYGYISPEYKDHAIKSVKHEGIDFVVIPETVHLSKLPDDEVSSGRGHHVNLDKIPSCLYCIYITVGINGTVEAELISWIEAMNKLKAVGRYDLISHGNKIKKRLNSLYETYITERQWTDDRIFTDEMYGRLRVISDKYNTGAILPASNSIDNIEYAAIVEHLPDNYDLINKLMKDSKKLKRMEDTINGLTADIDDIMERVRIKDVPEDADENTLQGSNGEEMVLQRSNDNDDLPDE